jgi:hypothetical protein
LLINLRWSRSFSSVEISYLEWNNVGSSLLIAEDSKISSQRKARKIPWAISGCLNIEALTGRDPVGLYRSPPDFRRREIFEVLRMRDQLAVFSIFV